MDGTAAPLSRSVATVARQATREGSDQPGVAPPFGLLGIPEANFAVRRDALDSIGGFDTSIEFHGEDTNLGRRLAARGRVRLDSRWFIYTSARRYKAFGRAHAFRLYVRNFCSETFQHRPVDVVHEDIRL